MKPYQVGDIAYFIESSRFIREGKLIRRSGDAFLFRFVEGGGIQISSHRLFPTEEAAQAALDRNRKQGSSGSLAFFG